MADIPEPGRQPNPEAYVGDEAVEAARGRGGQGVRRRNRNKNRQRGVVAPRFKGNCEALGKHVYDSGLPSSNQDLFTLVTKAIGEYIAANYEDAEESRVSRPD